MALVGTLSRAQTIALSLMIGKVLLKSGAETSRVEDTINRFCHINGYYDVNVFVTPTIIILGDESCGQSTLVSRVRYRSTNLSKISEINDFTYNLDKWELGYEETMDYLDRLLHGPALYGKWAQVLSAALCSASFSVMLDGNLYDFAAAFITGGLSTLLLKQLGGYRPSAFWENALAGSAIGILALSCCYFCPQCTQTNIIVGAVMPFLPGIAFTNGLRDYMAGDLISGNSRIAEAMLLATSIAVGLAASLLAWSYWGWNL